MPQAEPHALNEDKGKVEETPHRILLVDDDRTLRAVLAMQLEQMGYEAVEAANGRQALELLEQEGDSLDIILLDREMPVMDGMEFIAQLKAHPRFRKKPVIMATGSGQPEQISEGIDAGVFYYLVKPVSYDVLSTLVSSAMREAMRHKKTELVNGKQKNSFTLLQEGDFTFSTLQEADALSSLLANSYPEPDRVYPGLLALMNNAIEHGNLGIGLEEKAQLLAAGKLEAEISRRLLKPDNAQKNVQVSYRRTPDAMTVTITDQGQGFDWRSYLEINPERAVQGNGRGIAMAKIESFDTLHYNAAGNQVTASVVLDKAGLDTPPGKQTV